MSSNQWDKVAGPVCRKCHKEYFHGRGGLCYACWEKENEFEIRDKAGILNLLPESVIMSIVHPSRKEKKQEG